MARRKKESPEVHRKSIMKAAGQLFMGKGIENTSMNDIAGEAGYSKATLYVYFKNKEELVSVLVLESMQRLYDCIRQAMEETAGTWERYRRICDGLVSYQDEYPFYFKIILETINIDFETTNFMPEEKETFLVGERINNLLIELMKSGKEQGDIRSDIEIMPAIFTFWGTLSGLIQLAANKETYINSKMKKTKQEFLEYGFRMIYNSIAVLE